MTLPAEAPGTAPGRGRLTGRRVLVVGAGTRPSPEPDPPLGNGRAISVLAAREGAAVACADRDAEAAEATAALVRVEGPKDAVAQFFTDFGSTMEVEEFTPVSIAANDTDVLSVVQFRVRSRATGKTAAMDLHHWFTFRDGKIAHYRGTEDTAQTQAVLQS